MFGRFTTRRTVKKLLSGRVKLIAIGAIAVAYQLACAIEITIGAALSDFLQTVPSETSVEHDARITKTCVRIGIVLDGRRRRKVVEKL